MLRVTSNNLPKIYLKCKIGKSMSSSLSKAKFEMCQLLNNVIYYTVILIIKNTHTHTHNNYVIVQIIEIYCKELFRNQSFS